MLKEIFKILIFLLIFLLINACKSDYKKGYNSGYDDGKISGYNKGYSDGKTIGYKSGFSDGENKGFNNGRGVGYKEGEKDGYKKGTKKLVKDSFIPTMGSIILLLISFIIILSFLKYFQEPIKEKINIYMDIFKQIYLDFHIRKKLIMYTVRQKNIIKIKSKIYSFKITKELQKIASYENIEFDIFFIHNEIEKFLIQKEFLIINNITSKYKIYMKEIFNNKLTNNEKYHLLNKINAFLIDDIKKEIQIKELKLEYKKIMNEINKIKMQNNKKKLNIEHQIHTLKIQNSKAIKKLNKEKKRNNNKKDTIETLYIKHKEKEKLYNNFYKLLYSLDILLEITTISIIVKYLL